MLQHVYVKLNPEFSRKEQHQKEVFFHQEAWLKFKDESSKVLHLDGA
jgi:uncharacterized protein YecT (DUF1311 family)